MKMGTFSENLIRKMSKDVGVLLNESDLEWHQNALYAINQMSGKGEWGIIHEPWFEKCNNVSAMIGFVAGVTVVGAAIGIRRIVNKLSDDEKEEHS